MTTYTKNNDDDDVCIFSSKNLGLYMNCVL